MTQLTPAQRARVLEAMPMVEARAARMHRAWPKAAYEDLCAAGHHALCEVAPRHDPARGDLRAFAAKRVEGAMLDLAFQASFGGNRRIRAVTSARERDEQEPRKADLSDLSSAAATPEEARAQLTHDLELELTSMITASTWAMEEAVIQQVDASAVSAALKSGVSRLEPDEQTFVRLFYEEDKTLDEIAAVVGCSKKTAQRMHVRIKEVLRKRLYRLGISEAAVG